MIVEFKFEIDDKEAEKVYEELISVLINQKCGTEECVEECKRYGCRIGGFSELTVNEHGALLVLSTGNMWWVRRDGNGKVYLGYWGSRYGFPCCFNIWVGDRDGKEALIDGYQARLHIYVTSTPPEWGLRWFEQVLPVGADSWPPREKLKAIIYNPREHPQFAARRIVEYSRDAAFEFYFQKPDPTVEKINKILNETFPEYFKDP